MKLPRNAADGLFTKPSKMSRKEVDQRGTKSRKWKAVKSFYSENEARAVIARYPEVPPELALRVYTSRLLGGDPSLVLHGGGNTSVKLREGNILGEMREILFIKGSGIDLAAIEPSGFVGMELEPLRKLRGLDSHSR